MKPFNIFALCKHSFHNLGCQRSPGTIFNQTDGTVLVVSLCQMVNKLLHEWKDIGIVSGGGKNQLSILEGMFHCFAHIIPGKIMNNNFRAI